MARNTAAAGIFLVVGVAAVAQPATPAQTGYVRTIPGGEFDALESAARSQCPGTPVGLLTANGLTALESTYRAGLPPAQRSTLDAAAAGDTKRCKLADPAACSATKTLSALRRTGMLPDFAVAVCRPGVVGGS